jgi:hypothetical protein
MHIVVINRDQEEYVEAMRNALAPHEPLFVFDRCDPVAGVKYKVNIEGSGFLAGKMRDLGAEGVDDDILFLDGDKIPMGDIVSDIEGLRNKYDCICYGVEAGYEHSELRQFMRDEDFDGIVPFQSEGRPFASGCYSCGMWISKAAIRKLRELNGGRIFHPAFDGTWGDEDNFLADELHYSGFTIGFSTHVRLLGLFSDFNEKIDGLLQNFIKRINLRKELLKAKT